jgi:hypothetical protein
MLMSTRRQSLGQHDAEQKEAASKAASALVVLVLGSGDKVGHVDSRDLVRRQRLLDGREVGEDALESRIRVKGSDVNQEGEDGDRLV